MYCTTGTHPKGRLLHTIVNFFLLFLNKSPDPTFGYYHLAHSYVTVFHSFKPKVEKTYELQRVILHQPERPMVVFSKKN